MKWAASSNKKTRNTLTVGIGFTFIRYMYFMLQLKVVGSSHTFFPHILSECKEVERRGVRDDRRTHVAVTQKLGSGKMRGKTAHKIVSSTVILRDQFLCDSVAFSGRASSNDHPTAIFFFSCE